MYTLHCFFVKSCSSLCGQILCKLKGIILKAWTKKDYEKLSKSSTILRNVCNCYDYVEAAVLKPEINGPGEGFHRRRGRRAQHKFCWLFLFIFKGKPAKSPEQNVPYFFYVEQYYPRITHEFYMDQIKKIVLLWFFINPQMQHRQDRYPRKSDPSPCISTAKDFALPHYICMIETAA